MARIRTIKPEFCTSADSGALSRDARLFFLQLLTEADDEGRLAWIPRRLCGVLYPFDEDVSAAMLNGWATECCTRNMLQLYTADGATYAQVVNWTKHQKISHPTTSRLPAPPEASGEIPEKFRSPPESLRPDLGTGNREGKGKEPEGSASDDALPVDLLTSNIAPHPAADRLAAIVLAAYHATLPNCARVEVLNPKRGKRIHLANKLARQVCQQQGWPFDPQGFWESYFGECLADPWLRGEVANPKNPRWRQNLHVLIEEDRFAEIMDRAIARLKSEAA